MTDHNQQLTLLEDFVEPAIQARRKFVPFETNCPHCFALISDYPCPFCKKQSPGMLGFNYSEIIGMSEWLFSNASTDTPTFTRITEGKLWELIEQ